jgi:paraquat-inducible protein B
MISNETPPLPTAIVQTQGELSRRFATRFWFATIACAALSLGLFWFARERAGDVVMIAFEEGHGLKAEDRLRYRGIDVGAVERVELDGSRTGVVVHVRLTKDARSIATEGSKFWIVRPVFSLDAIRGLDTLIGAKYIAIEPAQQNGRLQKHFAGLDSPPIAVPASGSLEFTLDAKTRGGLENGAPILYRGFSIGKVIQVGLATDARTVRARCAIDSEYRGIVRKNSKFWNRSGWRLDIGLTGIKLDADTLSQIVSGGIEMATPADGSSPVSTGHRFTLYDAPESEWLTWQPSLVYGQAWDKVEAKMPQPIRIALRWQERTFGFRSNQQRSAWCLPLADGTVLCCSEQVVAPKNAIAGSTVIELSGMSFSPEQVKSTSEQSSEALIARVAFETALPAELVRWPIDQLATGLPEVLSDVYIAHADLSSVMSVDVARLSKTDMGWKIDESIVLDKDLQGLPVVSASTNQVIGVLSLKSLTQQLIVN